MKINGIKALDYQCQGDSLTLVLSETTVDAVSNLNTADETTAQAISQLVSKVEELETSNTALAAQVDYISMMTDTEVA